MFRFLYDFDMPWFERILITMWMTAEVVNRTFQDSPCSCTVLCSCGPCCQVPPKIPRVWVHWQKTSLRRSALLEMLSIPQRRHNPCLSKSILSHVRLKKPYFLHVCMLMCHTMSHTSHILQHFLMFHEQSCAQQFHLIVGLVLLRPPEIIIKPSPPGYEARFWSRSTSRRLGFLACWICVPEPNPTRTKWF